MKELESNCDSKMDLPESVVSSLSELNDDVPEVESIAEKATLLIEPAEKGSVRSAPWRENASSTEFVLSLDWPNTVKKMRYFKQMPMDIQSMELYEGIKEGLLFDAHCHLDRIFRIVFNQNLSDFYGINAKLPKEHASKPLDMLKNRYIDAFGGKKEIFEGCIHNICHPKYFNKRNWEWMTQEKGLYLSLGCHPESVRFYDEVDEYELLKAMEHPKVVAIGECGLDDKWANDDDNVFAA